MDGYGAWTVECFRRFSPAELAESVSHLSQHVELRYVGALARQQAGFVHIAQETTWVHLTIWDPEQTGMLLTVERDSGNVDPPFIVKVETEVAEDRFADGPERRAEIGALAQRIVASACEKLEMKIVHFDPAP
jgi:hypothetical protein